MNRVLLATLLAFVSGVGCTKKDTPAQSLASVQSNQPIQPVQPPHRAPETAEQQMPNLPPTPKMLPKIAAANEKYRAIAYPTPQSQVLRSLGAPRFTNEEGAFIWQARESTQAISFTAMFQPDGTMSLRKIDVLYDTSKLPVTNRPWPDFPRGASN